MINLKEIIKQSNNKDKIFESEKINNEEIVKLTENTRVYITDVMYYTNADGEIVWVYELISGDEVYHAFATTVMKRYFEEILTEYNKADKGIKGMREDFQHQNILFKMTKTQNKKGQMTYLPLFD